MGNAKSIQNPTRTNTINIIPAVQYVNFENVSIYISSNSASIIASKIK